MAGHHIFERAVPLITAFFLRVLATKGEAPKTVMMAMAGEKEAVSGVMAPDELLTASARHRGPDSRRFRGGGVCHAGSPVPRSSRSKRPAGIRVDLSLVAID